MDSEKLAYWVTLGILVLATGGSVAGYQGWRDGLAEGSMAMVSQASEIASNYSEMAALALGRVEYDQSSPSPAVADLEDSELERDIQDQVTNVVQNEIQTRVACVQRTLGRRQPELARWQNVRIKVRLLRQSLVIEAPQVPQEPVDTF